MLVIRFRDPKKHDIVSYVQQFPHAYLSRPNTLVIRNSYMAQAIDKYGLISGGYKGIKRLLRCHPFHAGGYDPIQ